MAFGSVSGAHLNPVVTMADRCFGGLSTRDVAAYLRCQVVGGCAGAVLANTMFSEPALQLSHTPRTGAGHWTAEVVATVGLLLVVFGAARSHGRSVAPFAVGGYIGAADFFTSSTSFANPAVTIARTLSDTFSGIEPASAPAYVPCQLLGLGTGILLVRALHFGTVPTYFRT